jgi:hypothetical protein
MTIRVLLLACALLAACAGGPPPARAPGEAGNEYFPLFEGAHWSYELRTGLFAKARLEVTARGERAVRDSNEELFLVEEQLDAEIYGLEPAGLVAYGRSGDYRTRIAAVQLDADGRLRVFGGEGVSILPLDPHPGQSWSDDAKVFSDAASGPSSGQRWTAKVENAGTVRVPAGTFDDVLVVHSAQWDATWSADEPLNTYEDYYARGIGLIRSVSRNNAAWWFWSSVDQRLVAVRFE